ncbi:MAG: metal-sulfur cluster assembly factor [Acidobacteriaceae bacterium]
MLTEAQVREALRDCYDPALPCNIVDLGLVIAIAVTPDPHAPGAGIPGVPPRSRVSISIILTTPSEEAHAQLVAQIENRLAGLETVSGTSVSVLSEPPWDPRRISPAGRRFLGLDGNPALVQIR